MNDDRKVPKLCDCGIWNPYDASFCRNCGSKFFKVLQFRKEANKTKQSGWFGKWIRGSKR